MAHSSRGDSLLISSWLEFSIATVLLTIRIYTTFLIVQHPNRYSKTATFSAIVAWAIGLLTAIFVQISVNNGIGRHIGDVSDATLPSALLYSALADATSRLSIAAGKVAVVMFLNALQLGVQTTWQRVLLGFVAVSNVCLNIALACVLLLQCSPPKVLWDPFVSGTCPGRHFNSIFAFVVTAWSAASDAVLALYPTYLFWSLAMATKAKVVLCTVFGLGLFAAACAVVTCYELHEIKDVADLTWDRVELSQWTYTEMWIVIMTASLPPTMPYFQKVATQTRGAVRSILDTLSNSERAPFRNLSWTTGERKTTGNVHSQELGATDFRAETQQQHSEVFEQPYSGV